MIYLICDNTYTNNGWGTYTNQIALQIKNKKDITIICRKKSKT